MGTSRGKPRRRRHLTVKKPRHSVRWLAQGHTACDREAGTRPCLSGASHASRFPGRREEAAASSSFLEAHCHFALPDVFMTQFSALQTARSVRTRRLAAAEENVEVARAARLAQILKEICDGIISYKGDRGPRMLFVAVLNTRVTCPHPTDFLHGLHLQTGAPITVARWPPWLQTSHLPGQVENNAQFLSSFHHSCKHTLSHWFQLGHGTEK